MRHLIKFKYFVLFWNKQHNQETSAESLPETRPLKCGVRTSCIAAPENVVHTELQPHPTPRKHDLQFNKILGVFYVHGSWRSSELEHILALEVPRGCNTGPLISIYARRWGPFIKDKLHKEHTSTVRRNHRQSTVWGLKESKVILDWAVSVLKTVLGKTLSMVNSTPSAKIHSLAVW